MADTLYKHDFYSWIQQQMGRLRQRQFDQLDQFPESFPFTVEQVLSPDFWPPA
jgi:hypothetical protein